MDSMGKREMAAVVGTDRRRGKRERERKGVAGGRALPFSVSDSQFCQQPCPFHPLLFFVRMDFLSLCSISSRVCVLCFQDKCGESVEERED